MIATVEGWSQLVRPWADFGVNSMASRHPFQGPLDMVGWLDGPTTAYVWQLYEVTTNGW